MTVFFLMEHGLLVRKNKQKGQKKGEYPSNPVIEEKFLDIQKQKFEMIQGFILDKDKDLRKEAEQIAFSEIDYYKASGKLAEYEALNAKQVT